MTEFAFQLRRGGSLALFTLHVVVIGVVVLAAAIVLSNRLYEPASSHDAIALGCGFGVFALIAYTRYCLGFPWLSASIVYLVLFWMFHYGLTFTAVLLPGVLAPFEEWEIEWVFWPNVRLAMILGLLGAAGFVCGIGAMHRRPLVVRERSDESHKYQQYFWVIGWLILLGGLAGVVATLRSAGGLALLQVSYGEFSNTAGGSRLSVFLDVAQIGCLLCLCGSRDRQWMMPLLAWSPLGIAMLVIGMRTEALMPMVAYVVVLAHRGVYFRRSVLVGAVLASMLIIPAVRTLRQVGLQGRAEVDLANLSPFETLTELGGTLRAAKAYVDWIGEGEDYLFGATYWAPFDRQLLTRIVPDRQPLALGEDERLPERHIDREGAVGLSATGESYFNFGPLGPFLYFGAVGALFGWLERRAPTTLRHCAVLGVAMPVFFFNIRGYFLSVPAHLAMGVALIATCHLIAKRNSDHNAAGVKSTEVVRVARHV